MSGRTILRLMSSLNFIFHGKLNKIRFIYFSFSLYFWHDYVNMELNGMKFYHGSFFHSAFVLSYKIFLKFWTDRSKSCQTEYTNIRLPIDDSLIHVLAVNHNQYALKAKYNVIYLEQTL